jgi:hypothetical protein
VQFDEAARRTTAPAAIAGEAEPWGYEAAAICEQYGAAIAEARRLNLPRHEVAALVRALRQRQQADLVAARARRRMMRARPG